MEFIEGYFVTVICDKCGDILCGKIWDSKHKVFCGCGRTLLWVGEGSYKVLVD